MRSLAFLCTVSACAFWPLAAYASTNLVQNPGFETGDTADWTEVGNWATPYNHVTTPGYNSSYASYSGNFNYQGLSGLTQNLVTTIGQAYDLSLYWDTTGANTDNDANGPTQTYEVLWDGVVLDTITNAALTPFTLLSFKVRGTGSDSITFEGYSNSGYNGTDNVSVVAATGSVPEPTSWAMMALGFAGLGYVGYGARKRKWFTSAA
jgi:PEP-CTERM motif